MDRILATALDLVDGSGIEALSMRRLAAKLGVDPMAIYHHLPNKAAVISGLVQMVFSQMQLPASTGGDWAQQVRAWVHAYRDLTRAHPHLVLQIVTDPVSVSQAAEMISEPLHAALMAAGVPAAKIPACAGLLVDYVNGFSLADAGPRPQGGPSQAEFDTGLDVIILGLQALAAGNPRTSSPT